MRTPLSLSSVSALLAASTLSLATAGCGDTETKKSPVHDIPGVTLLDTADDGNNTPLEDEEAPAGFSSYGFWYTYDDTGSCIYEENMANPDTVAMLDPLQGGILATAAYSALKIQPPPEQLTNAPDNTHGVRYTGGGQSYFGAGLGFKLENGYGAASNQGIDFKTAGYSGFRFWAYSSTGTSYIFKTQDLYSTPEAAKCTPGGDYPTCMGPQNCENAPIVTIQLAAATWTYVEIYFKTPPAPATTGQNLVLGPLARQNWEGVDNSTPPRDIKDLPAEPSHIFQLQFQTASAPGDAGSFDLIIDNFGFIEAGSTADKTAGVP